jgi:hypothetical protein
VECGDLGLEEDELQQRDRQLKKLLKDVKIVHNTLIEIVDQVRHGTTFIGNLT